MKRCLGMSRRNRLRLTLLATLALLFQQVALASYLCSPVDTTQRNGAMSMHCDGMPMAQGQAAPAMCVQHCAQQTPTTQDARLPNVPPLLLPAMLPAPPSLVGLPVSRATHERTAARRTPGLSPALRNRVLLI